MGVLDFVGMTQVLWSHAWKKVALRFPKCVSKFAVGVVDGARIGGKGQQRRKRLRPPPVPRGTHSQNETKRSHWYLHPGPRGSSSQRERHSEDCSALGW
eukprot:6296862-Prymnesium_polylepis.1